MEQGGRAILAIVSSVIGLAIVSVILSNQAQTSSVISSAGSALSGVIGAATAPVTGNTSGAIGNTLGDIGSVLGSLPVAY